MKEKQKITDNVNGFLNLKWFKILLLIVDIEKINQTDLYGETNYTNLIFKRF